MATFANISAVLSEMLNATMKDSINISMNSSNEKSFQMIPFTPKSLKIATRIIYVIIFVIGILGNAMVCYIIIKRHPGSKRRTIHNFTLNLAFSDLLVLFIYLPSQLHLFETNMKWKLGEAMCRITYFIVPLSVYSSIGTLIAISRDRYYAVIYPIASLERQQTKSALICIWVMSFMFTVPLILVSRIEQGYCTEMWPNQVLYHSYWIAAFCIQFAIPVSLLTVAHALIICHLRRLKLPSQSHFRSRLKARRRQQQRMSVMSVALVLAYTICMLPQHIIFFWMSFGNLRNQPYNMFIFQVANLMQILNSALNPVVYGTLNNDIKRGFISVFKRKSQARDSFQLWSRKPIELQTMASNCTSPLLQKRFSLPTSHYEEDKSRAKNRNGKNLIAQRNQAESDGSKNKRSIIYSFEKRSASSEKIEFKDDAHV